MNGLPPQNSSDRKNRWQAIRDRDHWVGLTLAKIGDKAPPTPLEKARVWFTRHSSSEPDFTNLVQGFKHIEDALVQGGIIIDDKPSVIGSPSFAWRKAKPKHGFVTVRVEEA